MMDEMEPRCKDCIYYNDLKHNFTIGKGYENSHCCTMFLKQRENLVVETTLNDRCEEFVPKSKAVDYTIGDIVYAVKRDASERPCEIVKSIVLSASYGKAIVDSIILDKCPEIKARDIMRSAVNYTSADGYIRLAVFPLEDCYKNIEDAEKVLKEG